MKLSISRVKRDPTLQLRENGLDMERIGDMVDAINDGVALPPVTIVGDENLLADGFHRVYAHERVGNEDVEVTKVEGDYNEALAIAIRANSNGSKQLTRVERNAAIKRLLIAGWTQERIAAETGVHRTTIVNIGNALAMRGEVVKPKQNATKPVAVLPTGSPARQLNDTTLVRIAERVPVEQQVEFAEAAAEAGLSEPRVREAITAMKEQGVTPTQAVAQRAPSSMKLPLMPGDVARDLRQRIEAFVSQRWSHKGQDVTFREVIDIASTVPTSLAVTELADVLDRVGQEFLDYAIELRTGGVIKALPSGANGVKVVTS